MCSIFGYIARADKGPSLKTLEAITRGNIARGPHAFGFSWIDSRGRLRMYKQTGRLTDHLGLLAMARDARMLIGHLRYATHGDATDQINNHPHPVDGGWLVHNGVIRNYEELVEDLYPVSACDSETLGLLIEREAGSIIQRVASAVEETDGGLAMLGLWSRPSTLIAARRGNPLSLAETREGMYLATLPAGLPDDAKSMADNRVMRFARPVNRKTGIVWSSLKIAAPAAPEYSLYQRRSGGQGGSCESEYRGG